MRSYVGMVRKQNGGTQLGCLLTCVANRQPAVWLHWFEDVGGARVKCVGGLVVQNRITRSTLTSRPVKRFKMKKSTGCMDVQHTSLQSTQTRGNYSSKARCTNKEHSAHLPCMDMLRLQR